MRRAVLARLFLLLIFGLTVILSSSAQAVKPTSPQREGEADEDNPAARLKWFMEGRLTPDGKAPAEWINHAMAQKFQLRALRQQQMRRMMQTLTPGQTPSISIGNGSTVWTPLGPAPIEPDPTEGVNWNETSGRVSAVAVDPSDPSGNTVYVGGATGGVWKSTNAAAADPRAVVWTPLIDQEQTLSAGAIAVSPDGNTILVGTGEAKTAIDSYYGRGILRSTDRGATWTLVTGGTGTTSSSTFTFLGVGVGKIAFNSSSPNFVVAATTSTGLSFAEGAFSSGPSWNGLWRSADGGATWTAVTGNITDTGGAQLGFNINTNSVVYNAATGKFYAHIRFHGIYESADNGLTWSRMANQPDPTVLSQANCGTNPTTASTCPIFRAEMAVVPGKNEMYVWYVGQGQTASFNHGVWFTTDGGATPWNQLDKTGIDTCDNSSGSGCSVAQGYFYDLAIGATRNPTDSNLTDVYVGAVNLYKCTVDPRSTGSASRCQSTNPAPKTFTNISHVYATGCGFGTFAKIHPDQHAISPSSQPNLIYFGNDGGIYRTVNAAALNTGTCGSQPANGLPYDSLNTNIGAMTQFVWATPHPTDPTGFIAGAQDNATTMTSSSIPGRNSSANGFSFQPFAGGDGGVNAIRTDLGGSIFYSSFTEAQIWSCSNGFSCNTVNNRVVDNSELLAPGTTIQDESAFYTPWLLDRYDPSKLILGSCRVWRGVSTPGTTQTFNGVILSQKLGNTSGALNCTSNDPQVSALAAGGPKGTTAGVAKVIYAAVYPSGAIWMTSSADAAAQPVTWTNVSASALNTKAYKISSLTIDQAGDPTGMTVYATIQGFGGAHVIKTVNGGTSWSDITGNLPDAPANTLAIDPDDHSVIYVGTDTGVYVTTNNGTTWTEVGPTLPGPVGASGFLPNVPVSHLAFSTAGSKKQLMAATYGRGIWLADLTTALPQVSFDQSSLNFGLVPKGTTSSSQAVKLTNSGGSDLTISNIAIGGTNASSFSVQSDDCPRSPTTLAVTAFCTINVTATPQAAGVLNGTVAVTDNAPGSPQSVPLTVTGAVGGILFAPTTLTFTNQAIGTTSASQAVKLTNNGSGPLTINSISFSGTNPGSFGQTNDCPVSPATLASSAFCTVTVTFTPQASGALTANLSVADNAPGSPHTVGVTGTGTTSAYVADSATLAFGNVAVNTQSSTQNVNLTNNGPGPVTFSNITTALPFKVVSNTCTGPIPNGGNCTVGVTFNPTATGAANGTLTIASNGSGPTSVALTGTGVPLFTFNPTSVTFNPQRVGVASASTGLTVTNATSSAQAITTLDITGANAGDFSKDTGCVAANLPATTGNCTVNITFTPSATGARNATLTVHSTGNPDVTVAITGTGAVPTVTPAPTTVNFNVQKVGTTSTSQNVTITGGGGVSAQITSIATAAPYSVALNTCGPLPKTLPSGQNCVVQVSFSPTATGAAPATNLTITDDNNGTPGSTQTVALTGTGAVPTIAAANLNFGNVKINSNANQNVTVNNTSQVPLVLTGISLTGSATLSITGGSCGTPSVGNPFTIAAGGNCTVAIKFAPTATTASSATLAVTSDTGGAAGTVTNVNVTGTGAQGTAAVSGGPLTFPGTPLTTSSSAKTITLTNTGAVSTSISAITFSGTNASDFTQSNTCNNTIAANGGTCVLNVTFKPSGTGSRTATITVTHDGSGSPSSTTMSGAGEDFTQSAGTGAATITAGTAATFTMTETPTGGNFTNAISFSCTGLDSTMGCAFNPPQVRPGATAATTTLTITTKKGSGTVPVGLAAGKHGNAALASLAFLVALPGMAVLLPMSGSRKITRRKRIGMMLLWLVVLTLGISMAGCSTSGPAGTKPGTYNVVVAATSGSLSHTTSVSVTVQ